jgi:hypothetical protein
MKRKVEERLDIFTIIKMFQAEREDWLHELYSKFLGDLCKEVWVQIEDERKIWAMINRAVKFYKEAKHAKKN